MIYPTGIPGKFREIIWNVFGTDQHGEDISFDVETKEEALRHKARYDKLGGKIIIRLMKFNGPAATWLEIKDVN